MVHSWRMRSLLFLLLLASACSSSQAISAIPDAGAGPQREPKVHRAKATECTEPRPAGTSGIPGGSCSKDAECTQGSNGRCSSILATPPSCSYDECTSDSACSGAQVCECRSKVESNRNLCRNGACRTDADCAGSYCSPSALGVSSNCRSKIETGSFGYFCHSKTDECVDDSDCGGGDFPAKACVFSTAKLHWACVELLCTK
jgi:hypothetical protein